MLNPNGQVMISDNRTGEKIPLYIGADAPEVEPTVTADPAADVVDTTQTGDVVDTKLPGDSVAQSAEEPATTDEPTRDAKGQFIPKSRFDEVNNRRKAAEDRLKQIDDAAAAAAQATEAAYDFDAAEKAYIDLTLDGKVDEAIAKRKEIRAAEQAEFKRTAGETATQVNKQLSINDKINEIGGRYESQYELFNPELETFNPEVMDDVASLYRGNLDSGKFADAPTAFENALLKVLRLHGVAVKTPPAAQMGVSNPAAAASARTAQTRVQAIVTQPPMIGKTGTGNPSNGDGVVKASELTEAQTMALPEATRRRLRGDMI